MNKTPWIPEKDFEEVAAEATQRMKDRVMCTREAYYCTHCQRCQKEEAI